MMNAAINTPQSKQSFDAEPILAKVFNQAEQEHQELQEVFEMLGWGDLPDALKIEIKEDVVAMTEELQGRYSSCDPHVHRRRQRVAYWVDAFQDGICSLATAIDALKVRSL